jgi:hypothetical protein
MNCVNIRGITQHYSQNTFEYIAWYLISLSRLL